MTKKDAMTQATPEVHRFVSEWIRKTSYPRLKEMAAVLSSGQATTVHLCIGCSRVVLHGPTRCDTCAAEVGGT